MHWTYSLDIGTWFFTYKRGKTVSKVISSTSYSYDLSVLEICQRFAANRAGNVPEEFATNLQQKKLNTKNLLATSSWQIFTAKLRQAFSKFEATVCHKAFIFVTKRFPSPTEVWCHDKIDLVVLKKKHFKMSQRRSLQFVTVLIENFTQLCM